MVESEIDDEICFDIHMNVEGLAPDWTIPDKVIKKMYYKNVCLNCPIHRDDWYRWSEKKIGGILINIF